MVRDTRRRRRRGHLWICAAALGLTLILTLTLLAQTASARTYVITDGDRVVTYTSFATDPGEVLGQMGLSLGERDTYTTEAVEGGSAITIRRAQSVTVHYHGEAMQVSSSGETVGELLSRLNLGVTGEDIVSHGMDVATYDGMKLRIDREVTRQEIYTKVISHEVKRCRDASIPEGVEDVLIEGVDGEMQCAATVTYLNGVEIQRKVLSETVTKAPVTEVIGVGAGGPPPDPDPEALPVIGDGYIILPTGEVLTYCKSDTIRATAYTHTDAGCDQITATGTVVRWGTVAVDPRYIPYGTRMFIMASDGSYVYGLAVAEDCGGDIKRDRMDLYMPTHAQCVEFGRRRCTIYFLGDPEQTDMMDSQE